MWHRIFHEKERKREREIGENMVDADNTSFRDGNTDKRVVRARARAKPVSPIQSCIAVIIAGTS